jgi:hypothetical protein
MSCLLYVTEEEASQKINIDDLYEKKHRRDLRQVSNFNKLLGRVHKRIQTTARNKRNEKQIWYTVPEFLFGEPNYDYGECVAYLVSKLEHNGFSVRYMHPHTLYVSWDNWVPTYARNEFKKRTGIVVDEKGNVLEKKGDREDDDPNNGMFNNNPNNNNPNNNNNNNPNNNNPNNNNNNSKKFTPIDQYKPKGNLVYHPDIFEKIEKKVVSFS